MFGQIRTATAADFRAAVDLLSAADLPTADLTTAHLALVASDETGILGVIGIEDYGDVGLLRSLVVSTHARGKGVGRSLVETLESSARQRGIRELWLLTPDAESFFSKLGFARQARDAAPEAVRGSAEYSGLCPDSAVLMSKTLALA